LREALLAEAWEKVPGLLTVKKSVETWGNGRFKVQGDRMTFDGQDLPPDLNTRIMAMVRQGEDPRAFFRFWERLQENPSFRSVQQLWPFLSHEGIPLTPDGCFLAYKSVRTDYMDHHSGKFENKPGSVHSMPRNMISDDPRTPCHEGFHVGALAYAETFGSTDKRIVVCKVDPKDVVCVPYDSSQRKMRVARYMVIGNHGTKLPDHLLDEEVDGTSVTDAAKKATERARATKPSPVRKAQKSARPSGFKKLDQMDIAQLMEQPIMALRVYASKGLDIVGASKIPGGKANLVQAIMQARWGR